MEVKEGSPYVRGLIEGAESFQPDPTSRAVWENLLIVCDELAESVAELETAQVSSRSTWKASIPTCATSRKKCTARSMPPTGTISTKKRPGTKRGRVCADGVSPVRRRGLL